MIESITIITLCILYLAFFRPGKTPPLNNPLVIDRPGKYHVTLAPNINLAQPFVEAIAKELTSFGSRVGDSNTLFFDVLDKHVKAHGHDNYLLAITQRNGILLFQATSPEGDLGPYQTIYEFAQDVLKRFPLAGEPDAAITKQIIHSAERIADNKRIDIKQLSAPAD